MAQGRSRTRRRHSRKQVSSRRDPLISPRVYAEKRALASQSRTPQELPDTAGLEWPAYMLDALRKFIDSQDLGVLASALRRHAALYWHPLVQDQLWHLLGLAGNPQEWNRLGWHQGEDHPPPRVLDVYKQLEALVTAHAGAVQPSKRIIWKRQPTKRGPRGGLPNPHPLGGAPDYIEPADLYLDWHSLKEAFAHEISTSRLQIPRAPKKEAMTKVQSIVRAVLDEAGPLWSTYREGKVVEPAERVPSGGRRRVRRMIPRIEYHWNEKVIERAASNVIDKPFTRKEGLPVRLACAVLAALLDVQPMTVRNKVHSYRPKRSR